MQAFGVGHFGSFILERRCKLGKGIEQREALNSARVGRNLTREQAIVQYPFLPRTGNLIEAEHNEAPEKQKRRQMKWRRDEVIQTSFQSGL